MALAPMVIAAVLLVPGWQGADKSKWVTIRSDDGTYTFELPTEPAFKGDLVKAAGGAPSPVPVMGWVCPWRGAVYMTQVVSVGSSRPNVNEARSLDEFQAGFLGTMHGTVLNQKNTPFGKHPGRELLVSGKDAQGNEIRNRCRVYVVGSTTYYLGVLIPAKQPMPAEADRFFNSFKLGADAAAAPVLPAAPAAKEPGEKTPAVAPEAGAETSADDPFDNSPEGAYRTFMMAIAGHNLAKLKQVSLPAERLDLLLTGDEPTADQVEALKARIVKEPIRRLKPGDDLVYPGNRKAKVKAVDVGPDRFMLIGDQSRIPARCQKVKGVWKVDAKPIVAAYKAIAAARAARAKVKANR